MKVRRAALVVAVNALTTALLLEVALRMFDPWGVVRYFAGLRAVYATFVEAPRGHVSLPGLHEFGTWSATVLPDGTRRVPATAAGAPCRLVLVGDSVTFGHGVNDGETWANLVATQLPGIHVVNAGVDGYDVENALLTVRDVPGDAYLYLLVDNDADGPLPWRHLREAAELPAVLSYLHLLVGRRPAAPPGDERFRRLLGQLRVDSRVRIVAFEQEHSLSVRVARDHPGGVTLIPRYTSFVSRADAHADALGNRQVAAHLLPIARAAVARGCGNGAVPPS